MVLPHYSDCLDQACVMANNDIDIWGCKEWAIFISLWWFEEKVIRNLLLLSHWIKKKQAGMKIGEKFKQYQISDFLKNITIHTEHDKW